MLDDSLRSSRESWSAAAELEKKKQREKQTIRGKHDPGVAGSGLPGQNPDSMSSGPWEGWLIAAGRDSPSVCRAQDADGQIVPFRTP